MKIYAHIFSFFMKTKLCCKFQPERRNISAAGAKKWDNIRVLRSAFSEDESFIEIDLVNKLQSIVEKQRDQIRTLDTSLADIKSELDEVIALLWSRAKWPRRSLINLPRNDQGRSKPVITPHSV
jgi:hypothetical protein